MHLPAFLETNTLRELVSIETPEAITRTIHRAQVLTIKIEVDTALRRRSRPTCDTCCRLSPSRFASMRCRTCSRARCTRCLQLACRFRATPSFSRSSLPLRSTSRESERDAGSARGQSDPRRRSPRRCHAEKRNSARHRHRLVRQRRPGRGRRGRGAPSSDHTEAHPHRGGRGRWASPSLAGRSPSCSAKRWLAAWSPRAGRIRHVI